MVKIGFQVEKSKKVFKMLRVKEYLSQISNFSWKNHRKRPARDYIERAVTRIKGDIPKQNLLKNEKIR